MIVTQIRNLAEALVHYSTKGNVILSNELELVIAVSGSNQVLPFKLNGDKIHIIGMQVPQLGFSLAMPDNIGHIQQIPNNSIISFSYVVPNMLRMADPFLNMYEHSMNDWGVPLFVPVIDRPTISLQLASNDLHSNPYVLATFYGCKFSYPLYQPNMSSNEAMTFNVQVAYFRYKLGKL